MQFAWPVRGAAMKTAVVLADPLGQVVPPASGSCRLSSRPSRWAHRGRCLEKLRRCPAAALISTQAPSAGRDRRGQPVLRG